MPSAPGMSLCVAIAVTCVQWRSAAGLPAPSPAMQLPPSPPPPAVVFVSEGALAESALRTGARGPARHRGQQPEPEPAPPPPQPEFNIRRGALVAKTREVSSASEGEETEVSLVTAEGTRVRVSEALALSLPFLARPSELQARLGPSPEAASPEAASPPLEADPPGDPVQDPKLPSPLPPSPRTVVTYFALGDEAHVEMMPYLSLVERLVGKQAYRRRSSTPAPAREVSSDPYLDQEQGADNVEGKLASMPAPVYGSPSPSLGG